LEFFIGHWPPALRSPATAHLGKGIAMYKLHFQRPIECPLDGRDNAAAVPLRTIFRMFVEPALEIERSAFSQG
jgi:hypothetical protein